MTATGRAVIEVKGVGKHFATRRNSLNVVLSGVDLEIQPGEFVTIVGASGCGKTTLLRMIGGLAPYTEGEIRVRGQTVQGVPKRIGFVFQNSALLPWRTIRENVTVGLNESRSELSSADVRDRVDLEGLTAYADYLPAQVSGGMQQRAGLARALVGEPDVLLMDEPFGAVDAFTRMRLQDELAGLVARTSATTVFVTHDVDEAVFLSTRVAVMGENPGRIKEIVPIDLPTPRLHRTELLGNPRAAELRDQILELVIGGRPVRVPQ
jgi:NitT/TauT family transport system ATP-binding protein